MSFSSLGLSTELLNAIALQGYTEATPVQQQAIPQILKGRDLLVSAQTGTGKTAGFTLPLLQLLNRAPSTHHRPIRALILTPTRELAAQVDESVRTYGKFLPLKSTVIFGGVGINPQISTLRKGVDIVVATPGRLLDHLGQRTIDLSQVDILVLDEADRMLDMGFIHDIRKILRVLPKQRQNLLFSATFSDEIRSLANGLLTDPAEIQIARRNTAAELISQQVFLVDQSRKRELLSYMIGAKNWQQVLVFTRTKHGANRLADQLQRDGLPSAAIHGNKSQTARTKALQQFKDGKIRVLVATDIAARGLDIQQLPHVVNYELPSVPEDYVHRIGRTGRAGYEGHAVSLVSTDEKKLLHGIERLLTSKIPRNVFEGYEPEERSQPQAERSGQGQRWNQGQPRHDGPRPSGSRSQHSGSDRPRAATSDASSSQPKPSQPKRGGSRTKPVSSRHRGNPNNP